MRSTVVPAKRRVTATTRGEGGGGDAGDAGGKVAIRDGTAEARHSTASAPEATADG